MNSEQLFFVSIVVCVLLYFISSFSCVVLCLMPDGRVSCFFWVFFNLSFYCSSILPIHDACVLIFASFAYVLCVLSVRFAFLRTQVRIRAYFGDLLLRVVFQHGSPGLAQMERCSIGDTGSSPSETNSQTFTVGQLLPVGDIK